MVTNAFGLDINLPDVRLVMHHAPLMGLDDYTQEAGRAGRDGKKAQALMLWHKYDFSINRRLIKDNQMALIGHELHERLDSLKALQEYAEDEHTCRWQLIGSFLGETVEHKCSKRCDNCKHRSN